MLIFSVGMIVGAVIAWITYDAIEIQRQLDEDNEEDMYDV